MEYVIRNVDDMSPADRAVVEQLLGQPLRENQQLVIQVVSVESKAAAQAEAVQPGGLPAWCGVFDGLPGDRVEELAEAIALRADLTRAAS